jgi:ABC-type phosphate/phosphonate transport system substrate-binding protein
MIAGLPMYDWPEVADAVDALWERIADDVRRHGIDAPPTLARAVPLDALWRAPDLLLGQVCALHPGREGRDTTAVVGTLVYDPPPGLPRCAPGDYYSVVVCRRTDAPGDPPPLTELAGARVAANGTDSQSGYWSLGHHVHHLTETGPLFGDVVFTGSHRASIVALASGVADVAAVDVHSWRLALAHEPAAAALRVIDTTDPTPGVVCVVSRRLVGLRPQVDAALGRAVRELAGTPVLGALHLSGYRPRRAAEFAVVTRHAGVAATRPWHGGARSAGP